MGLATAHILLENPKEPTLEPLEVRALADTGALFLCIPQEIADRLRLEATSHKEVTTADGTRRVCPYVGPIRVRLDNRECYVGAVVLGDEVLLGAVPMEDMDVVVLPAQRRVVPNPRHPRFAAGVVKRIGGG